MPLSLPPPALDSATVELVRRSCMRSPLATSSILVWPHVCFLNFFTMCRASRPGRSRCTFVSILLQAAEKDAAEPSSEEVAEGRLTDEAEPCYSRRASVIRYPRFALLVDSALV